MAVLADPAYVFVPGAGQLAVPKIILFLQKNIKVPGLVDIKQQSQKRPRPMVHPHAGDGIAVRQKLSRTLANDGRITAIDTNPRAIVDQIFSDQMGFDEDERQKIRASGSYRKRFQ